MRGSLSRMKSCAQPHFNGFMKITCFREMIGDNLEGGLSGFVGSAQNRYDSLMGCSPLHLQHGFVGHPLKQGVSEFILDFSAVPAGKQNLRLHQRLQRLSHGFRRLLQQRSEENWRERTTNAGGRLNNSACAWAPIKAL